MNAQVRNIVHDEYGEEREEEDEYVDFDEDPVEGEEEVRTGGSYQDQLMAAGVSMEDDDVYEELDDEEDGFPEEESQLRNHAGPSRRQEAQNGGKPLVSCLICGRGHTPRIRLFRWPRNTKIRRQWCRFFGIEETRDMQEQLNHCFICSFHFDPDGFFYTGSSSRDMQVFWSNCAMPKYRFKRPHDMRLFPWEHDLRQQNILRAVRNGVPAPPIIRFRESRFKIEGKTKHKVAVLTMPENPLVQFEFSYNRTSAIDGSKFYSCLHCRKAKLETKEKDSIRTIHLKDGKLLSRGDPFVGHHHACQPVLANEDLEEEMNARADGLVPSFDGHGGGGASDPTRHSGKQKLIYVDDACASLCVNSVVEVTEEEASAMEAMPPSALNPLSTFTDHNGVVHVIMESEYYAAAAREREDGEEEEVEEEEEEDTKEGILEVVEEEMVAEEEEAAAAIQQETAHRIKRRYLGRQRRGPLPIICHVCRVRIASTQALVAHLQKHIDKAPKCTRCDKQVDPATCFRSRRTIFCADCGEKLQNM